MDIRVPVIHAVTSDAVLAIPTFADLARRVMRVLGASGAVHVRGSRASGARLFAVAEALAAEQATTGAWIVVNDRLDVALAAGAYGAQLTSRSMRMADARLVAGGLPLGASVHYASEAEVAEREGADWLVAGNVFETGSHPGAPGHGDGFAAALRDVTSIPLVAIGGIKPHHVGPLLAAGFHGVAAISGIWAAADAERAAVEYLSAYDAHRASH
jgi:thiazole tautomerase (transcriptional regulator TenI)